LAFVLVSEIASLVVPPDVSRDLADSVVATFGANEKVESTVRQTIPRGMMRDRIKKLYAIECDGTLKLLQAEFDRLDAAKSNGTGHEPDDDVDW
jgi:hypothetical protein